MLQVLLFPESDLYPFLGRDDVDIIFHRFHSRGRGGAIGVVSERCVLTNPEAIFGGDDYFSPRIGCSMSGGHYSSIT